MFGQIGTVILLPVHCYVILIWQQSIVNCIKYGQRIFLSSALLFFYCIIFRDLTFIMMLEFKSIPWTHSL